MPVTIKVASHGAESVRQAQYSEILTPKELLDEVAPSLGKKCIDIIQSSFDGKRSEGLLASPNGFVYSVTRAYTDHHHLTIRPEDVWFAILTQLSAYINNHSGQFRGKFVSHVGKKKLAIDRGRASRYDVDMGDLATEMGLLLSENVVDKELQDWIMPAFTTTTTHDNVIASIIMMGSMKKYFNFEFTVQCGIPSVTLQGTKADWRKILRKLDKLRDWGAETTQFYSLLKPVITRFLQCFECRGMKDIIDFWQQVVITQNVETWIRDDGCGARRRGNKYYYSGWITAFCFWDEQGTCLYNLSRGSSTGEPKYCLDGVTYHTIDTDEVPPGWTSVPVTLLECGQSYNMMMVAGSVGIQCTRSGLSVTDGGSGGLDSVSPKFGWWKFEIGSDKEAYSGPATKRVFKSPPAGNATVGTSAAGSSLGPVKSLLRRRERSSVPEAPNIANQAASPRQLNMSLSYRGVTYKAGYSQPGQDLDSRAHSGAQHPWKVGLDESLSVLPQVRITRYSGDYPVHPYLLRARQDLSQDQGRNDTALGFGGGIAGGIAAAYIANGRDYYSGQESSGGYDDTGDAYTPDDSAYDFDTDDSNDPGFSTDASSWTDNLDSSRGSLDYTDYEGGFNPFDNGASFDNGGGSWDYDGSGGSNDGQVVDSRAHSGAQHPVSSVTSRVAASTSTGEGMKTPANAAASHGRTTVLSKTSSVPSSLPPMPAFDIHNRHKAFAQNGKQSRDLDQSLSMDLSKDTSVIDAAIAQKENRIAKLRKYGDELIQLGLKDTYKALSQELLALEADLRALQSQKSAALIENLRMEVPGLAEVARKEVETLGPPPQVVAGHSSVPAWGSPRPFDASSDWRRRVMRFVVGNRG